MGSGASSSKHTGRMDESTHKFLREKESEKSELLHQVEFFVLNIYSNFPYLDSTRFILSSELAQSALEKHLVSIEKNECLQMYHDINQCFMGSLEKEELYEEFQRIFSYYVRPRTIVQEFPNIGESFLPEELVDKGLIISCRDARHKKTDIDKVIHSYFREITEFIVIHISENYIKDFFLSRHYALWRSVERSNALATTVDDIRRAQHKAAKHVNVNIREVYRGDSILNPEISTSRRPDKLRPVLYNERMNSRKFTNFTIRSMINADIDDLVFILTGDNWFASLLSAVEALPVGFSVASASKMRLGFPIVFANKYFQIITGYSRSEIIGQNCKILQSDKTEKAKVAQMSKSLCAGKNHTTVITNKRKSGEPLRQLLSLKPIFNKNGEYLYVFCMHIDITDKANNYQKEYNFATKLMSTLPSKIITEDVGFLRSCMPSAASSPKGWVQNGNLFDAKTLASIQENIEVLNSSR
jgi:PAS domain S-box-containing protein